jgi:hypothetical protein
MFSDGNVSGRRCIDSIRLDAELSVVEAMAAQLVAGL